MFVLEAFVVFHDEGMIQTTQQVLFLRDVLEQGVLFDFLFAVALQDVQFLFLHFVGAAYQQNGSKFSLFQFLQHDQLIQSIDQFVSSLDLFVKLLCLLLFVLFNHCVQEATDDFLDDIHLYLRYHAIGLHDNIILISSLCFVLEQELLSVDLRPDCNRIDVFVFLQGSFNYDDDLLVVDIFCVFLYDYVATLVAVDLHQVQYLLYLFSGQFGEVAAFLNGPFHEVSEGDHKDLIAQHFAQSLSAQDKTGHIFLGFYCHLSHSIVKQSLLSKGISLFQFGHQLVALVHSCSAFFNDIERRSWISLVYNHLTLCVFLRDQCPSNRVLMIVGQTAEKPNILHKLFILLVLQNNDLLYCSPESVPVNGPEMAMLACLHRKRTRRFVQKRDFPEAITHSQGLLDLIVGYDLHHSFLDDEEAHGLGLLREDEGLRIDRTVEHLLRYIFNFCLTEIIEDEMILQAAEQEGHLLIFLLLLLEVKLLIVVYLVDCLLALAILSQQMLTYSSQPDSLRSLQLSICCGIPWFLNIIKVIQFKQSMQKRVKRTLIGLAIGLVLITVLLVLLGLAKVDLDQNALNYNTITANYSDATLYGPGLHWIGISNRFLRFNKNQQTLRFSNLSAFSSDFYKITANMEVTLQFNFSSGGDQFKAGSKFFTLFGENPMEIINPLIKDRILIALSSQKSSFYQSTSLPNTVLQSSLATSISSALLQWVTTSVNVIVQSVICEGSTSNTEIIDREIDSLIHDLQRTGVQQVELSNYFSSVYSNKQLQISSVSTALSMKALQLQRIYQMYGSNTTGFNISHIIYDNRPLKYNLNLVNILQELATIANRTFPY